MSEPTKQPGTPPDRVPTSDPSSLRNKPDPELPRSVVPSYQFVVMPLNVGSPADIFTVPVVAPAAYFLTPPPGWWMPYTSAGCSTRSAVQPANVSPPGSRPLSRSRVASWSALMASRSAPPEV